MALRYWAYLYLSPGFDPEINISESHSESCRFKAIGVDLKNRDQAIAVAKKLVSEGVQMIELCGGFGPLYIAKISEAINYAVPVGSVAYGPEARKPLLEILSG